VFTRKPINLGLGSPSLSTSSNNRVEHAQLVRSTHKRLGRLFAAHAGRSALET
jgi:hypothetical protein